jgi:TRAP-type C4-dicarboxylate transport system permease small subunit
MDKLDQLIAEALSEEDRAIMEETAQRGVLTEFLDQLSGRNAWLQWISYLYIAVFVGLFVWAGWQFFTATDPLVAVKWGLGAVLSMLVVGMVKLYLFSEVQTERVLREVKRLALIIAAREK